MDITIWALARTRQCIRVSASLYHSTTEDSSYLISAAVNLHLLATDFLAIHECHPAFSVQYARGLDRRFLLGQIRLNRSRFLSITGIAPVFLDTANGCFWPNSALHYGSEPVRFNAKVSASSHGPASGNEMAVWLIDVPTSGRRTFKRLFTLRSKLIVTWLVQEGESGKGACFGKAAKVSSGHQAFIQY